MPEGPDGKTIIIVKKVSGHGGHHGGAWKVAYADFITAMMALFLVLWLVNSASSSTRERIASYFRRPGVFEKGSGTPVEIGGGGILPDAFSPPSEENSQTQPVPDRKIYEVDTKGGPKPEGFRGDGDKDGTPEKAALGEVLGAQESRSKEEQKKDFEEVAAAIEEVINKVAEEGDKEGTEESEGTGALGKVDVKVDQRGLHLEIMDTPKASMFAVGSASILPEAQKELTRIAELLKTLPNPVDIEGHTDATPFKSGASRYDNWNLSIDRADAARRALQTVGVKEGQIARIVGYSAQRPKVPANPLDPSNRRISISMRYTEQAAKTLAGTQAVETQSRPINQKKAEEKAAAAPSAQSQSPTAGKPGPASAQSGPAAQAEKGLRIELQTTMPEGTPLQPSSEESGNRPVWVDKDKIFGIRDPFFGK